ncbi:ribonuclease H-like domain-containing protein [Tanacetum coccineum]|uniref:Ribonuclease H-like domain-containing protein n=1 Tax=Tanacetum coccineum TaxID=301880 RepID=A0ABQ5ATR6_9ASTR
MCILRLSVGQYGRLGHPTYPVLKNDLKIDSQSQTEFCEICQRAKQTREPFPLSDHTSSKLGLPSSVLNGKSPYEMITSEKCVMMGYSKYKKGYRLYSFDRRQFIFLRDVKCFESVFPFKDSASKTVDTSNNSNLMSQSDSSHSSVPGGDMNIVDFSEDNYENDAQNSDDIFATHDEHVTKVEENINSEASKFSHWTDAMNSEMNALLRNDTWDFIDLHKDIKAIGSKCIFNKKYKSSGEIDRYKARLVAQGFGQYEGIDYEEIFSLVVKMSKSDYSLYTKSDKDVSLALFVYVDDVINTGNNVSKIDKFKVFLKSKFMIKDLGKLKYFLGIEVINTDKGICLNQKKYVLDLLSEYGMLACKPAKTPLMSKLVISSEPTDNDPILDNITDYQKLMGKLIYLTNTRPDISYDVHCLSQFTHSPLKSHLKIAFKILRYLKSYPGLGIHFIKNYGMRLKAFSDADWAKCVVTIRSVTGYCVFLNDSLVSWKSKKQNTLYKSSTEAEYRHLASVTSEVLIVDCWIVEGLVLPSLDSHKLGQGP